MNFDLTEDQTLLKDTVSRALAAPGDDLWPSLAELGVLAAPFPESLGGLGLGPVETQIVAEAIGRAGAVLPYLPSIVMAGRGLTMGASPPEPVVAELLTGTTLIAWAHEESGRGHEAVRQTCLVAGRLTGGKDNVSYGDTARHAIITACEGGDEVVVLVDLETAGVSRRSYRLFDGAPAAGIAFEAVDVGSALVLARGTGAALLVRAVKEAGIAFRAAEAVGLMQLCLDATLEHLKTRRQFGEPLSAFQALRHKAAEMLVALEQARSMAMLAALSLDDEDDAARALAFDQIRHVVAGSARAVGQTAVQLHGGIGVTEEHPVGRAFRRLTMIDLEMSRG